MRLTPDTLNGVNNESDDPRMQEIEETRWHMAERVNHADNSNSVSSFSLLFLETIQLFLSLLPQQN